MEKIGLKPIDIFNVHKTTTTMKRKLFILLGIVLVLAICLILIFNGGKRKHIFIDKGFTEYISSFTGGTVSVQSVIRISLTKDVPGIEVNSPVEMKLFHFSPSIKGKAYWVDQRTVEFHPDHLLESGTEYTVSFHLGKVVKDIPKKFALFEFQFSTITQHLTVDIEGYEPYKGCELKMNRITGKILTADVVDPKSLECVLQAFYNKTSLPVSWTHDAAGLIHFFTVDSVVRNGQPENVTLTWSGKKISSLDADTKQVVIPSLNDFSVLSVTADQSDQQFVTVRFSDPLDMKQNLDGLLFIENQTKVSYEMHKMYVKVYPVSPIKGDFTLVVDAGIQNCSGDQLPSRHSFALTFESLNPTVRFIGKGVILPNSDQLNLPFQAVNVKAVDVKIIKIYENNISQFLQVNQLDGSSELTRAGRIIFKKKIRLDEQTPFVANTWQTYALDLKKFFKQEPGAIYHVSLSFHKKDAVLPCLGDNKDLQKNASQEESEQNEISETDNSSWDGPSNYYNDRG